MAATEPRPPMSLPLKIKLQIAIIDFFTARAFRSDGTINRRLYKFFDRPVPTNPTPRNGVKSHDVVVDPSRNLWFRLFLPAASTTTLPVIFFFHGGGFALLNPASLAYDAVCRRFVRRLNAVVISVNYRLTPEHRFPSQFDDGLDVLRFIEENHKSIELWPSNADLRKCFLAGDSAGGNLVHNLAVRIFQTQQSQENRSLLDRHLLRNVKLIGLIVIQPFFGGKEPAESEILLDGAPIVSLAKTRWLWKAFLPEGEDPDHWAVNVSGPNAVDISGLDLPPVILFVGGYDPLRDWQVKYGEWLESSGKVVEVLDYPAAPHAFYIFPEVPESEKLMVAVRGFVDKQCAMIQ